MASNLIRTATDGCTALGPGGVRLIGSSRLVSQHVLQYVAACIAACVAVCCGVFHCTALGPGGVRLINSAKVVSQRVLQCVTICCGVCCSALQCKALGPAGLRLLNCFEPVLQRMLQCVLQRMLRRVLQCVAVCCGATGVHSIDFENGLRCSFLSILYMCMYMYMCLCMYTCVYIYICTYIHICIRSPDFCDVLVQPNPAKMRPNMFIEMQNIILNGQRSNLFSNEPFEKRHVMSLFKRCLFSKDVSFQKMSLFKFYITTQSWGCIFIDAHSGFRFVFLWIMGLTFSGTGYAKSFSIKLVKRQLNGRNSLIHLGFAEDEYMYKH